MVDSSQSAKVPPHSIEAERAVLSAILNYRDAIHDAAEFLVPESFYDGRHGVIFASALELYNEGLPIDLVTISDNLKKKGKLDGIGGIEMLTDLMTVISSSVNVVHHAQIILDKWLLRRLKLAADDISQNALNAKNDAEDIINEAEHEIFKISQRKMGESFVSISDILPRTFDEIENYRQRKGSIIGTSTGFYEFDQMTSGFQDNDLIVIAGRPSMGKTALALNICVHVAIEESKSVGIFSLEMSANQISQRMLCAKAHISPHKLRAGMLRDEDYSRLGIAVGALWKCGSAAMYRTDEHVQQGRRASKSGKGSLPLTLSGPDLVWHSSRFLASAQKGRQSPSSGLLKLLQSVILY